MLKSDLRKKYLELRKSISPNQLDIQSRLISGHLCAYFDLTGKNVSCFVPISRFNELNTWFLLDHVKSNFYLPVLDGDEHLKHIKYTGKHAMKSNSWGILEPVSGEELIPDQFDLVLVPLLTLNNKGFRIGYGKGYYDRFLSRCKPGCLFIGLYQFEDFEEIDDIEITDIPVHYCVTPKGIHTFQTPK